MTLSLTASDFSGVSSRTFAFGDGESGHASTVTHVYDFPGTYTVTGKAVDARGNAGTRTDTIVVKPKPSGPKDVTPPVVTKLKLSRRKFAVGSKPTALTGRRVRKGTKIRFVLSEAARVDLSFERKARGFRKDGKCVKRRPAGVPKPRRCRRWVKVKGTITRNGKLGKNSIAFSGRIGRKRLRRAQYRLTLIATDAAGNRSKARRTKFKIVRAKRRRH